VKYCEIDIGQTSAFRPGAACSMLTSWPASGYGSGFSRTASTTPKIVVLAPMASASVKTTANVNPGRRRSPRSARRRSRPSASIRPTPFMR
jgi:hypothetical protein